jgi:WD40 repeat protein
MEKSATVGYLYPEKEGLMKKEQVPAQRGRFISSAILLIGLVALLFSCASYEYPEGYGFVKKVRLTGHTDQVTDMDLTPDGKYLATASFDDTVKIWDAVELKELGTLEGHADDVYAVSFGPGPHLVATGCRDGAVRVYELPSGEILHTMRGHAEAVYSVAFSPDGKQILSGGKDATVRVWDAESGELLKVFREHGDEISMVIVSPDSAIGYSTSHDGTLRSWYLKEDLAPGFIQKITRYGTTNLALSPDGKRIAFTGMDKIYDEAAKEWRKEYPLYIADIGSNGLEHIVTRLGHDRAAWGIAWSPDGSSLVTGGGDERLFFWGLKNQYDRQKVLPGVGNIWDLKFSPDGSRLFVAGSEGDVVVFIR